MTGLTNHGQTFKEHSAHQRESKLESGQARNSTLQSVQVKNYLSVLVQIGKNAGADFRRIESLYGIIAKDIHAQIISHNQIQPTNIKGRSRYTTGIDYFAFFFSNSSL